MQWQSDKTKELVLLSLLISIGMVLGILERFVFNPFIPGVKIGLANIVTLVAIGKFEVKKIYLIVIIRVVLVSIFAGSTISLFYSLAGGILSLSVMLIVYSAFGESVSKVGISALGGVFHNVGQLIILALITGRIQVALSYSPLLLIAGLLTGIFNGYIVKYLEPYLHKI